MATSPHVLQSCVCAILLLHSVSAGATLATTIGPDAPDPAVDPPSFACDEQGVSAIEQAEYVDTVLQRACGLMANSSHSTFLQYFSEVKKQLNGLTSELRRDAPLSAKDTGAINSLLSGFVSLKEEVEELRIGKANSQHMLELLREGVAQLRWAVTSLGKEVTQLSGDLTDEREDQNVLQNEVASMRKEQAQVLSLLGSIHQHQLMPPCPSGWSRAATFCFLIPPKDFVLSWDDAKRYCRKQHMHGVLASVHTDTAQSLREFLKEFSSNYFWLGLRRENVNAPWVWQDGTPLDHTEWLEEFHDNQRDFEKCCAYEQVLDMGRQGWRYLDCQFRFSFICQIRAY